MWKYCGIIFKWWFLILCLFFHPYLSFFFFLFFFSCILSTTHVYPSLDSRNSFPHTYTHHRVHPLIFFFPLLPLDSRSSLTLSFSSSLICYSLFFFFFFFSTWFHKFSSSLCDTSHINIACLLVSLSSNTHKTRMERKEKSPLLHHNTTAAPPPHYGMPATRGHISFYFFSLFLISCCFWF